MKFVIRTAARSDILRQYRYYLLEGKSERTAARFVDAVRAAIEMVCERPGIGAPKVLTSKKLIGLRSWPVRGFPEMRVYYLASEKVVRVIRVLHGRRDINPMLESA